MWARRQEDVRPANQTLITDFFPVVSNRRQQGDGVNAAQSHAVYAAKRAAMWFWCLLQDFIQFKAVPGEWLGVVPPDHPFIGVLGVDDGMRLNLPSELRLPDDLVWPARGMFAVVSDLDSVDVWVDGGTSCSLKFVTALDCSALG